MAVTLKIRRGTSTPNPANFVEGEPAWNTADGKLYIKNSAGQMVLIGSEPMTDVVTHSDNTYTYTGGMFGSNWTVYRNRLDLTGTEMRATVANNVGISAATALSTANMSGLTYV